MNIAGLRASPAISPHTGLLIHDHNVRVHMIQKANTRWMFEYCV